MGNITFPLLSVDQDRGSQTSDAEESPGRLIKPQLSGPQALDSVGDTGPENFHF